MKRMLFNATHPEELRVAIVDGQKLLDLDIESAVRDQKKGNIYKATVTRVEPSLEAAFVDYGTERHGFLPLKEISRAYFKNFSPSKPMAQVRIRDVIKEGQEFLVQIEKDERGNKGAALTTFISLAGRFLVLMPNNPKGGGISRRIEGEERTELRDVMSKLEVPTEHALIARTAGIGKTFESMQWDLDYLLHLWKAIEEASKDRTAPFLVYQESNLVVRAIRDYLRSDITEIVIDDEEIFQRASRFMEQVMPQNLTKLKRYTDTIPLFSRFQIEHQIESAFSRNVRLPAGGSLVIDHTEALVTIDVNSARATKGADIEETALQTNLEAVDEIARQLRVRDLGGLIVLDLIDMTSTRNQRTVEQRLSEAIKVDRARIQTGRISRFGLLEMSRQRLRSSLGEANYISCPRCDGTGHIRSVPSSALSILRILEEEALKENTEVIHAHLPVQTATFLLNEKRHELNVIEKRLATRIVIIPTQELETPHFNIKRLRGEELNETIESASYLIEYEDDEPDLNLKSVQKKLASEQPVVAYENLETPTKPPLPASKERGIFKRIVNLFSSSEEEEKTKADEKSDKNESQNKSQQRGRQQRSNQRGRRQGQGRSRNQAQGGRSGQQKDGGNRQNRQNQQNRRNPNQQSASEGDKPGSDEKTQTESSGNRNRRNTRGGRRRGGGGGSRQQNPQAKPEQGEGEGRSQRPSTGQGQRRSSTRPAQQQERTAKPSQEPNGNKAVEVDGNQSSPSPERKSPAAPETNQNRSPEA